MGGVIAIFSAILVLGILPFLHPQRMKGLTYYGPLKALFWAHVTNFFLLTLCGSFPSLPPFVWLSFCLTVCYFGFYFVLGRLCFFWDAVLV